VALVQHGRLLAIDEPAAVARRVDRPLLAVVAADRYRALLVLRALPHARSVYPFGETLHYTDARAGVAPEDIARELASHLASQGLGGATVTPIAPTIEDAFIALMGAPDGERAAA
jgi:hypothetical protein